jgi:hypothetical protein
MIAGGASFDTSPCPGRGRVSIANGGERSLNLQTRAIYGDSLVPKAQKSTGQRMGEYRSKQLSLAAGSGRFGVY